MSHGQVLKTDADFDNAIIFECVVSITRKGEHMGSGQLLKQTDYYIHTIDAVYYKDDCEFKICSMVH